MARLPRRHIRRGFYYVRLRTNGGARLFPDPSDRPAFELHLAHALDSYRAKIHAYAWLPASANFLIRIGDAPLGRIVQATASPYSKYVNRRLGLTGHRFESRYGANLVSGGDVLEVVAHLHRVAIQWGICTDAATTVASSHDAYLGKTATPWLTMTLIPKLLRTRGFSVRNGYKQFMRGVNATLLCHGTKARPGPHDLCVDEISFVKWLAKRQQPHCPSLHELIDPIARRLSIDAYELGSLSRERHLSFARAVIAWYATKAHVATQTEVARHFNRDPSTLSVSLARHLREQPQYFLSSLDAFLRGASRSAADGKGH
jgi:hypothetical protein